MDSNKRFALILITTMVAIVGIMFIVPLYMNLILYVDRTF